jgi:hypothetical protein
MAARQVRQVEASVTLTSEEGKEVFSARDSVANPSTSLGAGNKAEYWTSYALTRDVPLKNVPPGRYLLRVEAQARASSSAAVRETLITVTRQD